MRQSKAIIIAIILLSGLLLAGCVPKAFDLQSISDYAQNNRDTLETVSAEAMKVLNDGEAIVYKDGEFTYASYLEDNYITLSGEEDKYNQLVTFLKSEDSIYLIERCNDNVIFQVSSGDTIVITDTDKDEMDFSMVNREDLKWEKSIDDSSIVFISDHRKDKETYHKGMYYRVDMEYLGDSLYVYHLTTDYPWYSWFIG